MTENVVLTVSVIVRVNSHTQYLSNQTETITPTVLVTHPIKVNTRLFLLVQFALKKRPNKFFES